MSTTQTAVPEWPGYAGWFGLLLAMVWLLDPAAFTGPLPAVTLALAGCWLFGLYRHVQHTWGASLEGGP
ncbi:hypothetical protein [Halorarius litoreus]|uniref:hypothetical protein n=1 Tax=Halorarius litoreus TaxID=2962676 RepID=UPI0020CBA09A|nr:hypothetical protein [Halorarius litoreus]